MNNSKFTLMLSLRFESEDAIDFITDILGVLPTSYQTKGGTKFKFIQLGKNIWLFSKKYSNWDGSVSICVEDFLSNIPDYLQRIKIAQKYAKCFLRISVVSDWAQAGFFIEPKEIGRIYDLDIPVEISIFSWGNCVTE